MPSGASVGAYEAHELRDEDARQYGGNSVLKAVHNVEHIIGPELVKQKFKTRDLRDIDKFMIHLDGSRDKKNLGANAILGVSMACARAGAAEMVCCSFNLAGNDVFLICAYRVFLCISFSDRLRR